MLLVISVLKIHIFKEKTNKKTEAHWQNWILSDRIVYSTAFITSVVEHWLEGVIAKWIQQLESIQWTTAHKLVLYHWTSTPGKSDFWHYKTSDQSQDHIKKTII